MCLKPYLCCQECVQYRVPEAPELALGQELGDRLVGYLLAR